MKIGFIGLGNMAGAMIGGLLNKDLVSADDIYGVDINAEMATKRAEEFKIHAGTDSFAVVSNVDYLVLAIKPQFAKGAIEGFKSALKKEQDTFGLDDIVTYLDQHEELRKSMKNIISQNTK